MSYVHAFLCAGTNGLNLTTVVAWPEAADAETFVGHKGVGAVKIHECTATSA